jgi:hypothetical protein
MRTDRTYFERHSTGPERQRKKEKECKKKARTSVEHRGQTFYTISEFRGLEEVEEMSNEIG